MNQQLVIDDLCIEIQASPRRKSIALQVNARGVVCKTPLKYNKKDLHHWLATKAEWIEKQQILMSSDIEAPDWSIGGFAWVLGQKTDIILTNTPNQQQLLDQQLVLRVNDKVDIKKQAHQQIKTLAQFYITERCAF